MNQSAAILLFSRTARAEAAAKAFGGGTRVAESLIRRTEATIARTGLPVFRSTEADQRGATFGQRLASAMQRVYDQGFDKVIVVGSDCAAVRTSHLRAAAQKLDEGLNVLGPDRRGGVWLIGLHRKDFLATDFENLRWGIENLFADLAGAFPRLELLTTLQDVNTLGDLRRVWNQIRAFFSHLADLIFGNTPVFTRDYRLLSEAVIAVPVGRGPPRSHGL